MKQSKLLSEFFLLLVAGLVSYTSLFPSQARAQSYAVGIGSYAVPQTPGGIVSADLNGDGKLDLAVPTATGISILLAKPDGSFANHVDYSTGQNTPEALVVGDCNGDGKLDLIVTTAIPPTVEVFLGNGNGTFQSPSSFSIPDATEAFGITAADFNGDKKLDLAVAANNNGVTVVAVFLGKGNGTFGAETNYPTFGSFTVIAADFNKDGKIDLAVGSENGQQDDQLSILLGKGDGTFLPYTTYPVPGGGDDLLATADLNHDGKLDLVVASFTYTFGGVSVLLGNGNGTFEPYVWYVSPTAVSGTFGVAIADFNGDGKPDIATNNYSAGNIAVYLGNGDGTFKAGVPYPGSTFPVGVAVGDFNGDGTQDIASVAGINNQGSVNILVGKGDGTFSTHTNLTIPIDPTVTLTGDFNGDGKPDIAVTSATTPGSVSVLLNKGIGQFQTITNTSVYFPFLAVTGDFNGDGKLDIVVTAQDSVSGSEQLTALLGNGDGTLRTPVKTNISTTPWSIAAADFNLDGKLDVIASPESSGGLTLFFGHGDGTFTAGPLINIGADATVLFAADFNGDHRPDIAANTANGVSILLGNGDGTFQQHQDILAGDVIQKVGDFNTDGKLDLVVSLANGQFGIALGNGDGTFRAPVRPISYALGTGPSVVGDFNGDGKLDYAAVDSFDRVLWILLGNGDGTFGQRIDLKTEPGPWSIAAADFSGDGATDLAAGIGQLGSSGAVSLYTNIPVGSLFPSSLNFGSVKVGVRSSPLKTTLYNSGGGPLKISSITTTGDFSQTHTCGATLAVGTACTISVTFKPTAAGARKGTVSIKDTANVKSQTIALSGIGSN